MLIACDLDGTLADITHRVGYVKHKPKNWGAFYAGVHLDAPNVPVVETYKALQAAGNTMIIVSARCGSTAEVTQQWLIHHGIRWEKLYMRPEGNHIEDTIMKGLLLEKIKIDFGKVPDLVFDDRRRVVDFWRSHGIPCFQVAKGEF